MAASFNTGREEKGKTLDSLGAFNPDLLMHPELLSQAFIQLLLRERKISSGDDESRDRLTELYLRHVIPLPQRPLPNSRWGRRMERSGARQSPAGVQSRSSVNDNRKRPLIVFDGSSSNAGPVRLKKAEVATASGATDRLKPPPSKNLSNPIRKLSSTATPPLSSSSTTTSSSSHAAVSGPGSPHSSPAGNGGPSSPSVMKLKREGNSLGESTSPEAKKRIQHVKWP